MLIPTIIFTNKRVHFEEPVADTQPQQTPQQVSQQNVSKCLQPQWCDVRRDFKGRKIIVAHKGPCYGNGPNTNGGGKGGTEDVRKGGNGGGNGGAKGAGKKEDGGKNGGNGGGKNGGDGDGQKQPHELAPEEDEKLTALKAEGKSWRDIAQEMSKPQGVLKERWKVINPDKPGGQANGDKKKNGGQGDNKKDDTKPATEDADKKAEEPKKMTKKEKKAAKNEAEQAAAAETKPADEKKEENKAKSTSGGKPASEARFTMNEWVTLQEDDLFSFGELQLLSELIAQYDAGRWQMVASRFFDKTGRRVHADDVRDKFMGAMV